METMSEAFEQWRSERNRALSELDMNWARKKMPSASSDHVRLCAMHKARVECEDISLEFRKASEIWLREMGYSRMYGMQFEGGEYGNDER